MQQARAVYRRVATTFTFRTWARCVLHGTRVRGKLEVVVTKWWARHTRIVSPRGENPPASYGNHEQFQAKSSPLEGNLNGG
jgi:hypothetical protein